MRPQFVIAALAAVLATQAQAQVQAQTPDPAPYAPQGDYRDQRQLPPRPSGDDPAARAAWERARGEAYRRAPDSVYDDSDELQRWARVAVAAGQRGAAKKRPRKD